MDIYGLWELHWRTRRVAVVRLCDSFNLYTELVLALSHLKAIAFYFFRDYILSCISPELRDIA